MGRSLSRQTQQFALGIRITPRTAIGARGANNCALLDYRLPLRDRKFADSPLEGTGFELPVRGCDEPGFRSFCIALDCSRSARGESCASWRNRKFVDSPREGDGFEPSVPRRNKLCVAPATNVPGRDDPLRRQLGSGCKAELDQPTTLRRVRLARIRVWRS